MRLQIPERLLQRFTVMTRETIKPTKKVVVRCGYEGDLSLSVEAITRDAAVLSSPQGEYPPVMIERKDVFAFTAEMEEWAEQNGVTLVREKPTHHTLFDTDQSGLNLIEDKITIYGEFHAEGSEDNIVLMRLRFGF